MKSYFYVFLDNIGEILLKLMRIFQIWIKMMENAGGLLCVFQFYKRDQ
jgi:hypothetical protein